MPKQFQITVLADNAGKRLDTVIANTTNELTRSQVKGLIEKKLVRIDGQPVTKAGTTLFEGQKIEVTIPDPTKLELTPQDVGIKILYEDAHLAVIEKPAGLSVHPSETETKPTVVHGLLHSLQSLSSVGGVARPGIVHRIDKGTSGILVVSKTDAAHLGLSQQFKAHTIDRRYLALVYGHLCAKSGKNSAKNSGRIATLYGRNPKDRKKMTGKVKEGRTAVTHWAVQESFGTALTLVECRLETGRTHQIRVHLSELGFPLVGDPVYGDHTRKAKAVAKLDAALSRACLEVSHQLLHAYFLGFEHPVTKARLNFESQLPLDFAGVLTLARSAL